MSPTSESPDIPTLIEALGDPSAYALEAESVEVRQTHISVVFLVADRAYKIKKPVDFGFVDYTTLDRRRHFCEEEVRLNRRLAPDVYRGVRPVTADGNSLVMDGEGEPVEWAVEMVRLPDEATLEARLEEGVVGEDGIGEIAERVASFHADAERGGEISEYARFEAVSGNLLDNFEGSRDQIGSTVHSRVFERARERTEGELDERRELIERRAREGRACDTHGDLRLDHVYLFPDREDRRDVEIIDCIEFNVAFRYADPISDIAFLVMDLEVAGRDDLAETVAEHYLEAAADESGRELMDLYVSYRAAVRGKVEGLKALEEEVPADDRRDARQSAAAHWLLALGRLEEPRRRPALVLVSGLPATGKSTIARELASQANFRVIDSDVVRKELAGLSPHEDASSELESGIYSADWSDRTYGACRLRAEQALFAGERVIVDATFYRADRRRAFIETARDWGVPAVVLECRAPREVVRERIEGRTGGPSDADWSVYEHLEKAWDDYDAASERIVHPVSTDRPVSSTLDEAREVLAERGLL